ncbi:MAG TPA: ATP-binding cassette domain-containing protein [Solimonas sp.]|nr:ATP-binding cassette domain-containing protein [Solimonas sp.]
MLTASKLTLRRGARTLLDQVSFTIHPGWKVGVVGRNGTGKSSLFALVLGQLSADGGELQLARNLPVASVAQETPALPDPAIEFVLDGDVELRRLERELATAEAAHDVARIAQLHDRLAAIGGYAARARAGQLLHGLGFSPEDQLRAVADFSGGWRMRLNLARTLMCRSELLLLDEPTNHLDLDAVIWLQDYLQHYPGALLLISHDRDFLDEVTGHTLHLEQQQATLYGGGYSTFERTRAERLALQGAQFEQQQRQIAHLKAFIARFKAKASKAKQAQSRVKQLDRMELVAPAHLDSEFSFSFRAPERLPSPLLRFERARVGYGERTILSDLKFSLQPGDRIALLGPNGAGKSTLVRTLAGELPALGGTAMRDPYLKVGYFAQHQVDQLDLAASPIKHLQRLDPGALEQNLRDYLGSFNFRGDRAYEAVGPFSGGEKARLALALVAYQRPNLLLLDEPTNHLDLDMRHALETALQEYPGAVVLVSHDRHLIAACSDELWRVADGRCTPFDGDLDDYARWLRSRDSETAAPTPRRDAGPSSAEVRRSAADQRALERPLREQIKKLDNRMAKLQPRLAALDAELAETGIYEAGRRTELQKKLQEQAELRREMAGLEEEWLLASEQLEGLQSAG